ncbi:pyrroloquinoline quinone precursor peptide PqqA, partial [Acinetobacter baumannii]
MRFNQVIHFTRLILTGVKFMQWTKPAFTDLRIGF